MKILLFFFPFFLPGNNKFPNENVGFSQEQQVQRGLHVFPKGKKVPRGKCTCFLGNNKFPGELHVFPKERIHLPRGTCCSSREMGIFLEEWYYFPRKLVVSWGKWSFPHTL
jgi:hypothetical protein